MSAADVGDGTSIAGPSEHASSLAQGHANSIHATRSAEATPAPDDSNLESLHSVPMTAMGSTSSQLEQDGLDVDSSTNYGTRSRQRTGGSRPNYAEDKDIDMEMEAVGTHQKNAVKKGPQSSNPTIPLPANQDVGILTGGGFAAINSNAQSRSLEQATTLSTTSERGSGLAPSKKRKHPGSGTTVPSQHASNGTSQKSRVTSANNSKSYVETNMMSFDRCGARLNHKKQLVADDGTALSRNDHVYFICEPPGEPYYLARIMEFLHVNNDMDAPIDAMRVNWYYRPKDIQRRVQDTRVVFASMHSDTCPLTSIRGKCRILHLNDIDNLDNYRVQKDSFWFDKLYDRYMHRYYEVVPTSKVVNVPQRVKSVLDERWKFILIEIGRGRDLTSASKKCKKCEQFAANHDSVDCAVCKNTYHMRCVRPPLLKKPARGFAWACAACSRAQELRLEARHTPAVSESANVDEDEPQEDDEVVVGSDVETRSSSGVPEHHPPPTAAQIAQANLWPWRYLGVHSRVEDALDYDDRIYPRASSRLGPRHQANVNVWHGRPVVFVKPSDIKRKYLKTAGSTKGSKLSKETAAALEADKEQRLKRPKWVMDEPVGYVARGEDEPIETKGKKEYTAQLTFRMPDASKFTERGMDESPAGNVSEEIVDKYMKDVEQIAPQYAADYQIGTESLKCSVDFLTKAIEKLQENNYDTEKALQAMKNLSPQKDLKLPVLSPDEIKRFEEGVAKFGSELHAVARFVSPTIKESRIVRYYYMWKKTVRGRKIWGNYQGRRAKKEAKALEKLGEPNTGVKLLDEVADDRDDSAFDNDKAQQQKRGFECKFCTTRSSRQWRRAPGTAPGTRVPRDPSSKNSKDKSNWLTLALCGRCAYLWRRYAIVYESMEEVSKKIAAAGGRASKRRIDEELMRTIFEAQHESGDLIPLPVAQEVNKSGMEVPSNIVQQEEPPKKKTKGERDGTDDTPEVVPEKKKAPERSVEPAPLTPEPPRVKVHPCAICKTVDLEGHELLKCRDCRMHVHGACYGVSAQVNTKPWFCDMCRNDHNLQISTVYECVLCPIKYTAQELMEPLRVSHKKKSDREREKERLEREMVQEAGKRWRQEQEAAGRPVNPREALKRTAWNNWAHVTCALWTKEIKFGNADLLDAAEGLGFIPHDRLEAQCKICKISGMPTVKCHLSTCNAFFHVACAHQNEYIFGFDVSLVKGSRRDSVNVIKLDQETGVATAAIWCPTHVPSTYVHNILEKTESGLTAMQLFARTYKQADQSVTGTVRRAAQFSANLPPQISLPTTNGTHSPRATSPARTDAAVPDYGVREKNSTSGRWKKCCTCHVKHSPKWWPILRQTHQRYDILPPTNGISRNNRVDGGVNGVTPSQSGKIAGESVNESTMINGTIKSEWERSPRISFIPDAKDDLVYQCHKCHVEKRSPPSSPSQHRSRERIVPPPPQQAPPPPQPQADPGYYSHNYSQPPPTIPPGPNPAQPPHPSTIPPMYPHGRAYMDGPPPPPMPFGPPPARYGGWPVSPGPQWPQPGGRSGSYHSAPPPPAQQTSPAGPNTSVPPGGMYGPPPQGYRPPGLEYHNPYHGPPQHQPSYSVPPPPNAVHQQSSPPPGPYSHPHHHQPPSLPVSTSSVHGSRPVSPPRYSSERPLAHSPVPPPPAATHGRSYAPDHSRQSSLDSPSMGSYGPPGPRMYGQPPPLAPPSHHRPSSSQVQSLAKIAQAATDSVPRPSSRQANTDILGTPRMATGMMSGRPGVPPSPNQRSITPADGLRDERAGPGASASPNLRNLLS